jgi:hypothetical protein
MKTQKEIVFLLNEIIVKNASDLKTGKFPYKIISNESKSVILSHETAKPFNSLCSKILTINDWDQKFSQKFIENKIESLICRSYDDISNDVLEESVGQMLKELESYKIEQEVVLPVFGLLLNTEIYELGNVSFKELTDHTYSEIIERVIFAIDSTKNTAEGKSYLKDLLKLQLDSAFKVGTLASIKLIAEPVRALERAQEECGRSLDLLRFATPYVQQNSKEIGFGLIGDVFSGRGLSLSFSDDGSLKTSLSNIGSWIPFEFNDQIHQKLQKIGITTLSNLIRKDKISDFEKRLLSAVFWCAKAQLQTLPEFRLLCLITSLESVLNPRGDRPIRMGVAEGCALLTGQELDQRRQIRDFIMKMYDLRSRVSHGGHPEVFENDLGWLTSITGAVIFELIKKIEDFKDQKELLLWLDDKRMT